MQINISFNSNLGIGDHANFAYTLPLYKQRGYSINVNCPPDREIFFKTVGATINHSKYPSHPYTHPDNLPHDWSKLPVCPVWTLSKVMNSFRNPMPFIGEKESLWQELKKVKLQANPKHFYINFPRPLILVHVRSASDWKSYKEPLVYNLIKETEGTIITLDWHNSPFLVHDRSIRLSPSLEETLSLMEQSDLLIGIDSGILHSALYTNIKAIGIWNNYHPLPFCIPRENTLNLVSNKLSYLEKKEFNVIYDIVSPETITKYALKLLKNTVQETIITTEIERTCYLKDNIVVDKRKSLYKAWNFLKNCTNPVVFEENNIFNYPEGIHNLDFAWTNKNIISQMKPKSAILVDFYDSIDYITFSFRLTPDMVKTELKISSLSLIFGRKLKIISFKDVSIPVDISCREWTHVYLSKNLLIINDKEYTIDVDLSEEIKHNKNIEIKDLLINKEKKDFSYLLNNGFKQDNDLFVR